MAFDPKVLEDIVKSSGLSFRTTARSFIFSCPRCQKKDKLYILKSDGRFVCWYCKEIDNFKGRCEYALSELLGVRIKELREKLYGWAEPTGSAFLDVQLTDWFDDDDSVPGDALDAELLPIEYPPDVYPIDHPFSAKGMAYLESRGIEPWLAKQYDLHYCPPKRRVAFPVKSRGRLLGYQARTIEEHEWWSEERGELLRMPKILSEGLADKREKIVMFADNLNGSEHAVVAEGPVDAMKAHLCGGNVATMGKAVSPLQIQLIKNSGVKRIYFALDPDAAAETTRLVKDVSDLECFLLLPPEGREDLGDATLEEVYVQFLRARRVHPGHIFVHIASPVFARAD